MVALAITAAQVLTVADATNTFVQGVAGGTITAGMAVYSDLTDSNKYKAADANLSAAAAVVGGIALHGASSGQPLRVQTAGTIELGAGAAPASGMIYILGGTVAGDWEPCTALVSTWYSTTLGVGIGTNKIKLGISVYGFAL